MSFLIKTRKSPSGIPAELADWGVDDSGEFGLPNRTVWLLRDVMTLSGVLDWDMPELAPTWPPPGIDEWRAGDVQYYLDEEADGCSPSEPDDGPITEDERRAYVEMQEGWKRARVSRSPDPAKVPGEKFCTCDHWHVLAPEAGLISVAVTDFLERYLASPLEYFKSHGDLPEAVVANVQRFLDFDGRGEPEYVLEEQLKLVKIWIQFNRLAMDCDGYELLP